MAAWLLLSGVVRASFCFGNMPGYSACVAWNARKKQMLWLQDASSWLRARDGRKERRWKAAPGKGLELGAACHSRIFQRGGRPAAGCGGGGLLVSRNVFGDGCPFLQFPIPIPPPSPFPSRRVGTEHPAHFCYVLIGRDSISRGTCFPVVFPLFINNSTSPRVPRRWMPW